MSESMFLHYNKYGKEVFIIRYSVRFAHQKTPAFAGVF